MKNSSRSARLAEIENFARQRSLTEAELDELERLRDWQRVRRFRLPRQIAACEAKLTRLQGEMAALS